MTTEIAREDKLDVLMKIMGNLIERIRKCNENSSC